MTHFFRLRNSPLRTQSGAGLVELMVGMAVGLFVVGVVVAIFLNNKAVAEVQESMGRLQENARFVRDTLSRDIRNAGPSGCAGIVRPPTVVLNGGGNTFLSDWGTPVRGYDASGNSWLPSLPTELSTLSPAAGTDVLTLRHAIGIVSGLQQPMATRRSHVEVGPRAGSQIPPGSVVLVTDCASASVFQVTAFDPGASGKLKHATGNNMSPGNADADLAANYNVDAEVYVMVSTTYYLAPSIRVPGRRALWSFSWPNYTGMGQPQELVTGVENMQISYGANTDASSSSTNYLRANAVTNWANVISVRASLVLATPKDGSAMSAQPYQFDGATVTPTDRRMRRVLDMVTSIRNKSL